MGQFGAGGMNSEIDQKYMGLNNQAHVFMYPFYMTTFLNVTSNVGMSRWLFWLRVIK